MRTLFRLPFRIVSGADARAGNPFLGSESDQVIVSVDTLAGERMFRHLKDPAMGAYDLVVFDEAHKLSADRQPDFRVRKTDRYKLAEALSGSHVEGDRWELPWSAQHLLLLTATPHMGKDNPYYFLWRLLLPEVLSTRDAFDAFPGESRRRHFVRRTKEELVHFDGSPLYPQRNCDTLSYELSPGEQEVYDETTKYLNYYYNRARVLNRSAVRLAMSVFQRRLASSTYALLRSFERRIEKIEGLIDDIRSGRLTEEDLARLQRNLDHLDDVFESRTADEESVISDEGEQHEEFEGNALGGTIAVNLNELETERLEVGRLFEDVSMKDYIEQAVTDDADVVVQRLEGHLTEEQVHALEERERVLYGEGGDVRRRLAHLKEDAQQENYRRLLPGYVRRFVERTAPLLDLRVEGDLGSAFALVSNRQGAADPLLSALEEYSEPARERLTVYKPRNREDAVWMHPGEPVFDGLSAAVLARFGGDGLRGAVFMDPYATEPYLVYIARVSVEEHGQTSREPDLFDGPGNGKAGRKPVESRLVGLRQSGDGTVVECPVEHLLLLKGVRDYAPGQVPLATLARGMIRDAVEFARGEVVERLAQSHRRRRINELPARMEFVSRGFDYQAAELAAARYRVAEKARTGDSHANAELSKIKERQRTLTAFRNRILAEMEMEAELIQAGDVEFLVHALVVPVQDSEAAERYDADVEAIAVDVATAYEERFSAKVDDVSRPERARRAGLPDWPGFDLRSRRPGGERAIEVKGRARSGNVEVSENEWAKACNLRDDYWLYVVFDCATPQPRLVRVQDPFAKLLMRSRESLAFTITPGAVMEAAE